MDIATVLFWLRPRCSFESPGDDSKRLAGKLCIPWESQHLALKDSRPAEDEDKKPSTVLRTLEGPTNICSPLHEV